MSCRCQIVFALLLTVLPLCIVAKRFSIEHGFLDVPLFGKKFLPQALPEVRRLNPPARSEQGYDGQLYAQLALSPLLTDPDLPQAIPNLRYRARRIGLPILAYIAGLGRPAWILQAYSVLNVFFWLALMGTLARTVGFAGFRERILAVAILWTTGSLISVERALTDLPALTVGVWGMMLAETRVAAAGGLLALTALFKETSVLSFPALIWIGRQHPPRRLVWMVPLLGLPMMLWLCYVQFQTVENGMGLHLFNLPGVGWWEKMFRTLPGAPKTLIEFAAAAAIAVQVIYLVTRPRMASPWWRGGIGWAALAVLVGAPVWAVQFGYLRILLPLTVAFNVLIYQHERGRVYVAWLVLGNVAMFCCAWRAAAWWLTLAWPAFECWHQWSVSRSSVRNLESVDLALSQQPQMSA